MTSRVGRSVRANCALLAAIVLATGAYAQGQQRVFDLREQEATKSIPEFARQAGLQISAPTDVLKGMRTPAVKGEFTPEEALDRLLAGTGLTYRYVDEKTLSIVPKTTRAERAEQVHLAQVDQGKDSGAGALTSPTASSPESSTSPVKLDQVIVTAQKRSERLQDVPMAVTAVSTDSLVGSNQSRVQDYYTKIPGLSYTPGLFGQPFISIRGITTGGSSSVNPTVGIMVDDTPYGSSIGLGGGGYGMPDLDPSELQRIEVLRGPQGTLYGAASIGGLVKFVTVDPSTDRVSGHLQVGTSIISNGAKAGYNVRGAINLPITDTLAVRASAFSREDPGYIDDVATGRRDVNRAVAEGGHLSALFKPSDIFTLKLSALLQHNQLDGLPYAQPTAGDLKQAFILGGLRTSNTDQAYSATVTANLGNITLTSVTGYSINKVRSLYDYTPIIPASFAVTQFGLAGTGTLYDGNFETRKLSQELRLAGTIGRRVDWLIGGFYTHENSPIVQSIYAVSPVTNAALAKWVDLIAPAHFTEYAGFADLTFHIGDQVDVQIGGRESESRLSAWGTDVGPYDTVFLRQPSPIDFPGRETTTHAATYLFSPQYKFTPDLMVYARLSSGYRPGGPNITPLSNVPPDFQPDKAYNYELGVKGAVLDHKLSFDAATYYIDWKNLQLLLRSPISTTERYYANAGQAKSEGVELSVEARPAGGLTLSAWGAWNEAVLTQPLPATSTAVAPSGAPLPYAAKLTGNFAVNESFPLFQDVVGNGGGSVSYVGDRQGVFTAGTGARQHLPGYAQLNLNLGAEYESWAINFYANNVTDRRGLLLGGLGFTYTNAFSYIQPRTIGVSVSKTL